MIRSERVSGRSRDGLTEPATVLELLRPGGELVVSRLDRDVLNLTLTVKRLDEEFFEG